MVDIPDTETLLVPAPAPASPAAGAGPFSAQQLYLTGDDTLRISSFCTVADTLIAVHGRVFVDGELKTFRLEANTFSDGSERLQSHALPRGYLVNLVAFASSGQPRQGQCYVHVQLSRGFEPASAFMSGTLIQGYITDREELAWPGTPLKTTLDGPGVVRTITGANPAAGVEITETVPDRRRWQVLAFAATLVASATAVARIPRLILDDGTTDYLQLNHAQTVSASETRRLYWIPIGFVNQGGSGGTHLQGFPDRLEFIAGHRIRTSTVDFQAGDNWGAPLYVVREWLEVSL